MNKLFLWIAALLTFALQSCQKDDGIREEIDSLRDRVAALETKVGEVNAGIEALHAMMDASLVIVGVTPAESGEGYLIEFSDGTRYPVINAEEIEGAVTPLMGIDQQGYWTISLDGGKTATQIKSNGAPVSAWPVAGGEQQENAEGVTPRLRVSSDGMWEVSLDGGSSWEALLQDGQPVEALGDHVGYSNSFRSVSYDEADKVLVVEMLGSGEVLRLPVFDGFDLTIAAGETEPFYLGETREFEVVQTNVAEAQIRPLKGWSAELGETTLRITAPSEAQAQAEFTLSIVITSKEGYLKIVPLKLTLINETLYANACEAWRNFEAGTAKNVLLDFSYAGYKHGEVAPPDVWGLGYKVYNVLDYGLDPTGQTSSRQAFVELLSSLKLTGQNDQGKNQANASANAIIYFPEGDYVLHDESDDEKRDTPLVNEGQTVEYKSSDIIILGGNFVIKGAGRDKTRLIMKTKNYPATGDLWSSPVMINIKNNSSRIGDSYSALATVSADASKGSFSVEVNSAIGISSGDWVMLYLQSKDTELVAKELAPKTVDKPAMTDIQTICVYDYHQVKSVSGNTVTFCEPIMHEVEARYGWEIREFPHYENVGIEDLTFVGNSKENFGHHVSWEDDGAFKPLNMMRLTNSWVRRVDFANVSEALTFSSTANCSAYDIVISGNRGHSSVRSQGSSRVFIGKVIDRTSGYECTTSSGLPGSSFLQTAGQYHATGVSNQSMGTVLWNNTWGDDALFESHSKQPRATLVDRCTGGFVQWRFGGDVSNVPNHLRDLTIWNLNATNVKHDFGSSVFKWWLTANDWWKIMPPIIVGFHGGEVNFALTDENGEKQLEYLESNGQAVEPQSLYEAQLRKRLGYVPGWLNSLK